MREALKRGAELILSSPIAARVGARRVRGRTLILAYHGIIPRSEARSAWPGGERSLHVPQALFAAQLDGLLRFADVTPLTRLDETGSGRPRIAITFDDAYHGAVTAGFDELVARDLPATVFVAPGRLDGHTFWWDALADASGELDARVRQHALDVLAGDDDRVREWAVGERRPFNSALPQYARAATRATLARAAQRPGITVGSHTWSHANLARLDADALSAELTRPLAWLRGEYADRAIPWLAYPYGLESPEARRAAHAAGYSAALRIDGGWHRASEASPFARPRLNVPAGLSVRGLMARVMGTFPA